MNDVDPARHLSRAELEARFAALPAAPRDAGRVARIVRRVDHVRETPDRVRLSLEDGVPGDDWTRRPPRDPAAQLAVIRHDVAQLIANGQPVTLFGDNLLVELDVSTANLPPGSELRVGAARVRATPKPHDGCRLFKSRFGLDALHFVQHAPTRPLNLRGVYWQVIEPGDVAIGDPIEVLSRGC